MADLLPNKGLPQGAMSEFKRLARDMEKDMVALVNPEIVRAINTGKMDDDFEDRLKARITKWRNDTQVAVHQDLTARWRSEMRRLGTFYRGRIRGIQKVDPPEAFLFPAQAIDAIANSLWVSAMDTVRSAQTVYQLTENRFSG